jgi:hypothetical protein
LAAVPAGPLTHTHTHTHTPASCGGPFPCSALSLSASFCGLAQHLHLLLPALLLLPLQPSGLVHGHHLQPPDAGRQQSTAKTGTSVTAFHPTTAIVLHQLSIIIISAHQHAYAVLW